MKIIASANAPKAIGPYSQAVESAGFVFVSGQIPLDPSTGEISGDDIQTQTRRVLLSLEAVLAETGLNLTNVAKTTVFMTNLGEFSRMNEIYGKLFKNNPPARATIEVKALPRGAKIAIEAIAEKI